MSKMHDVAGIQRNVVDVIDVSDDDDQCNSETNVLSYQPVSGTNSFQNASYLYQESIRFNQEQTPTSQTPSVAIYDREDGLQLVKNFNTIHYDVQTLNESLAANGSNQEVMKNKLSQTFVHHNSGLHSADMSRVVVEDEFSRIKRKSSSKEHLINGDILIHENSHLNDDMNNVQSAKPGCNNIAIFNNMGHKSSPNEPSEQFILPHSVKVLAVSHKQLVEKFRRVEHKAVKTKQIPSILRRSTHPKTPVVENLDFGPTHNNQFSNPMMNEIITSAPLNKEFDASKTPESSTPSAIQECVGHLNFIEETLNHHECEPVRKKQKTQPKITRLSKIASILDLKKEVAELRRRIIILQANQKQEIRNEVRRVLQSIFSPGIVCNLLDQETLTNGTR